MFDTESAKPRTTLDQLGEHTDSTLKPYNVLVSRNLGNMTVTLAIPMYQFFGMSAVANQSGLQEQDINDPSEISQRKLDPAHAKKLALYLLRALVDHVRVDLTNNNRESPPSLQQIQSRLGRQPYFATQPIVANLRKAGVGGHDLRAESIAPGFARIFLSDADVLWVIDGQHRRFAMDFLFDFLGSIQTTRKYPKRGSLYPDADGSDVTPEEMAVWSEAFKAARQSCNVIVDVHLGLDPNQERQIFHDLNNLGKTVSSSLAYQFDSSNPVNAFVKDELISGGAISCKVSEGDTSSWSDDDGSITYKDLVAVNARLFLNKTNVSSATPKDVAERSAQCLRFWKAIDSIPGWGRPQAKQRTVAAQPVVLKALAKVVYDFSFGKESDPNTAEKIIEELPQLDLSHTNPCWQYYSSTAHEPTLASLSDYLPPTGDGANRDLGGWDPAEHVFRFGAKHNDIFPVVADMIRWMLKLPSRQKKA